MSTTKKHAFSSVILILAVGLAALCGFHFGLPLCTKWRSASKPVRLQRAFGLSITLDKAKRISDRKVVLNYTIRDAKKLGPEVHPVFGSARVTSGPFAKLNFDKPGIVLTGDQEGDLVHGLGTVKVSPGAKRCTIRQEIKLLRPDKKIRITFSGLTPSSVPLKVKAAGYEFVVDRVRVNELMDTEHPEGPSKANGETDWSFVADGKDRFTAVEMTTNCPRGWLDASYAVLVTEKGPEHYLDSCTFESDDAADDSHLCKYAYTFTKIYPTPKKMVFEIRKRLPPDLKDVAYVTFKDIPITP